MRPHIRKFAAFVTLLLSACGDGANDRNANTAGADSSPAPLRVALLTPGPISDKAWNGGAYEGLIAIRDSMGARISHIQTRTPAEFEENFRQYGAQGYSIVFGHGFEFQDAAERVAPSYPKTVYIVTSGRVTGPNVAGVSFAFEEASYQAGIIAGAMTKSNTIGMIGGTELPPVSASFTAFARGARSVNPRVQVLTSYIGNWDDVSAGKEQALAQIARGVDIIFQNADAAGLGVFQAARDKQVYTFGANANQNDIAPNVVLGSVVINLRKAFLQIAREVQHDNFVGHVFEMGVRQDVVYLELNPVLRDRIPASAIAASDSVGRALKSGTFHALDDILQGADSAIPMKKKP